MRLGRLVLISMVCFAVLTAAALAVERPQKLTGFGGIPFGITEHELRDRVPLVKPDGYETDPETVWFESANPVEVDGAPFLLSFMMERGILRRIGAMRAGPAENGTCKSEFDAMVDYLASQYGPPDRTSQRGTWEFYEASFAFEDHGVIELLTDLNKRHMYAWTTSCTSVRRRSRGSAN
jgi:hypothetical protein